MMAMKDLFYLVNAFMNRNKATEENQELAVPIEAAEDTRVLPGSSSSSVKVKNGNLLSSLEPFQHLLPDLCGMDINQQKKLHKALYSAGVSAALSLQKFVYEIPRKNADNSSSGEISPEDFDVKEILEHLNKSTAFEDASKTFRMMSNNMEEIMQKMDGGKMLMTMISNEVAAAALAAFASATLRKPPTKHVENMMQTSQEIGPPLLDDEDTPERDSVPAQQLKRSASAGKTVPDQPPLKENARQRPSSCTRHNKINGTTATAGDRTIKKTNSSSTESSQSSIIAVADLEDGDEDDDDEDCMCDTEAEEEMEGEDSLFRYVCAAGYEDLAKLLVSMRNSAEFVQQSDSTPLMEACCGGHADVVKTLIQAGADVNALSSTRNTALIYACASGHIDCVKELLATGKCDLNIRNEAGHCALMEAANIGNVDIMKILIRQGAKPSCVVESVDYKESALTLAAYKGHFEAVKYLLSLMPKEKNAQEEEELHTALMEASMDGHVEVAKLLLDTGAKVNLASESFENPLTLASCGGHTEMVKLLLDSGAELEEPNDEGYTPLMEASREGHYDVVELLLNRGANVNAKIEEGVETSLTLAASGGFKSVVELLVSRGGDLTIGERTPLYEACQEGHQDVVQYIVQHLRKSYSLQANKKAKVNPLQEIQKDLNEALLCAAGIDSAAICNLLIENGAQIDCFSKENRTPLMEASRQNCLNVVELLIKKGADVNKIASPCLGKDVDVGIPKAKSSKKLTPKDCCTLKCPCCVPPSLKKSAKEVCTAAGIPQAPFSTGQLPTVKRPAAPSRSSTPNQGKCTPSAKYKLSNNATMNKTQRSLSTSSSTATLSDPSAWLDNSATNDAQNNDTALTLACVGGHTGLVSLLIKRGAHIEHRDKKGFTPLILAATGDHVEICKLLLEAGAQVDAQADRTKDTALSLACSGGRKEVVELLLKHGANKEHRNLSDYTPLSLAASGGYVEIIQFLLNSGAEINSRTNSKLGISPLMLAAMNGHEEATRLLLENGSDINAQIETNKNTALTLACFQGRAEVARLLIQYGANVEHRAKTGLTPLMEAANGGYVDVGAVLLHSAADVNTSPVPTSRDTALTIAADKGHSAFVALLLQHDAQINARNKKGCTALWLACNGGHLETVKVLVDNKADMDAQDNRKLTPLMIAFRKGHSKLVKYLVEHVTQFPSDSDCHRYIATLTDQDLIEKCRQSTQFISDAKDKQAEQANKAAQSLLEMLAQEEALEEYKKRNKQRQKEKKKAKKQAQKAPSPEPTVEIDRSMILAEKPAEKAAIPPVEKLVEIAQEIIPKETIPISVESKASAINQAPPSKNSPKSSSSVQSQKQNGTSSMKPKVSQTSRSAKSSSVIMTNTLNETTFGKNSKKNGTIQNGPTQNPVTSTNFGNSEDDEWLRASKKRASIKESTKGAFNATSSINTNSAKMSLSNMANQPNASSSLDEQMAAELALATGRRPSLQVLNIASNAIARLIGRAGSNVNKIREATGAHVEVEKQSTRKEQTTRKITLKGSGDAVRNAFRMIELLLKDHNLLIGEIVDRVMAPQRKSPSLSSSSESSHHPSAPPSRPQPICTPPSAPCSPMTITAGKLIITPQEEMKKMPVFPVPKSGPSPLASGQTTMQNCCSTTPTTNVWQKRAEAIREKKNSLPQDPTPFIENLGPARLVSPISPPNHNNNIALHQPSVESTKSTFGAINSKPETLLATAPATVKQVEEKKSTTVMAAFNGGDELAILSKEEHQRKAPGYARPQSSASANTQQHPLTNMEKMHEDPTSAAAPSLFDVFASRWTANPLDAPVADENLVDNGGSNIQNSWSYLLEDWKGDNHQQQQSHNHQASSGNLGIHLMSSPSSHDNKSHSPHHQQQQMQNQHHLLWSSPIGNQQPTTNGGASFFQNSNQSPGSPYHHQQPQQHSPQQQQLATSSANPSYYPGLLNAAAAASAALAANPQPQQVQQQQQHHNFYQQQQTQQKAMSFPQLGVAAAFGSGQQQSVIGPPNSNNFQAIHQQQAPPGFGQQVNSPATLRGQPSPHAFLPASIGNVPSGRQQQATTPSLGLVSAHPQHPLNFPSMADPHTNFISSSTRFDFFSRRQM